MRETALYKKFKAKIAKADPNCFYYKIPDTFGIGGMRPFDSFLVMNGVAFAIEFKSKTALLTQYQSYQLAEFIVAGGESFIFKEGQDNMDLFIEYIIMVSLIRLESHNPYLYPSWESYKERRGC